MRSLNTLFLKKWNALIGIILALLGFTTACDDIESPVEYGTPHATFIINGNVKDESSSGNIKNIKVELDDNIVYTDESGNYQITFEDFPDDHTYTIQFKDVDGVDNGEYEDLETTIEFKDAEYTGGKGWYSGETEQELNVTLKSKE